MANKITSTITETTANIMAVNTDTSSVETVQRFIPESYAKDTSSALKYLQKHSVNDNIVPVKVLSLETVETLRATTPEKFINASFVLDKRITSKDGVKVLTRTFTETTANIMAVNTDTSSVETVQRFIPESYAKDTSSALKYLQKHSVNDNIVPVKVLSLETVETLRGITEPDFVKISEIIEKR